MTLNIWKKLLIVTLIDLLIVTLTDLLINMYPVIEINDKYILLFL